MVSLQPVLAAVLEQLGVRVDHPPSAEQWARLLLRIDKLLAATVTDDDDGDNSEWPIGSGGGSAAGRQLLVHTDPRIRTPATALAGAVQVLLDSELAGSQMLLLEAARQASGDLLAAVAVLMEERGRSTPPARMPSLAADAATSDSLYTAEYGERNNGAAAPVSKGPPRPLPSAPPSALSSLPMLSGPPSLPARLESDRLRGLAEEAGSYDIVHELSEIFLNDIPMRIARLEGAALTADREQLRAGGHALQGACATFGAARMAQIAGEIEQHAADPSSRLTPMALVGAVQQLKAELEYIAGELQAGRFSKLPHALRRTADSKPPLRSWSEPASAR